MIIPSLAINFERVEPKRRYFCSWREDCSTVAQVKLNGDYLCVVHSESYIRSQAEKFLEDVREYVRMITP